MNEGAIAALALIVAAAGAIGGLGGGVLLVPILVAGGVTPQAAAPLGLLTVAAGSLAATPANVRAGHINHRIGVVTELGAGVGAVAGAMAGDVAPERVLTGFLAVAALAAATTCVVRRGLRNQPDPRLAPSAVGEYPKALAGTYLLSTTAVVPYAARRTALGIGASTIAGVVAGATGASGGFIRTPTLCEVMHVPMRVAAATTTFTLGITCAAALTAQAAQGRVDLSVAPVVIAAAFAGGRLGARTQHLLDPAVTRRTLAAMLTLVGAALVARLLRG